MNIMRFGIIERVIRYLFFGGLIYFGINYKYIILGIAANILYMLYIKLKYRDKSKTFDIYNKKTFVVVAIFTAMFFEIFLNGQFLENQNNILYLLVGMGFIAEIYIFCTSDFKN